MLVDNFSLFFLDNLWFADWLRAPGSVWALSRIMPSVDEFEDEKCVVSFSFLNLTILSRHSDSSFC